MDGKGNSVKSDNVVLVFEPACDAHWMKDVVQFPNAVSNEINNKTAILVTRPNHKQQELQKYLKLFLLGDTVPENYEYFDKLTFSEIVTNPLWYLKACEKAAELGSILILYPFYGNVFKGAKKFKVKRWLKFKKAKVILKSDASLNFSSHGTLSFKSGNKATLIEKWKDVKKYFFIDKIVCENAGIYEGLMKNQTHLSAKFTHIPNCPLDIYHHQQVTPFFTRENCFLFVGRVDDKQKGCDILIKTWTDIFRKIPNWKLKIVGVTSQQTKEYWRQHINESVYRSIEWISPCSPSRLIQIYNSAKIVVCPSRWESGPIVLIESVLCGCSFIGTAVGEIPTALEGLPGLVKEGTSFEEQMLYFAENPEKAASQAAELFEKMQSRKWGFQVKTKFKVH